MNFWSKDVYSAGKSQEWGMEAICPPMTRYYHTKSRETWKVIDREF